MKMKRWLALILVGIIAISGSACSSGSTDVGGHKDDSDPPESNGETLGSTKVYDYEDKGEIFFDYPDSYSFSDDTGIATFENSDGTLRLMFKTTVSNVNDMENVIEYYESYNSYEGFSQEDINIAGYDALRIYYTDDWGDYWMSTLIKLGDDSGLFDGISIYVSSSSGEELLSLPEIHDIIESIRVTE